LYRRDVMRDMKSDWKKWSLAERIGAVTIAAVFVFSASSLLSMTLHV
jgi:hypothetical protein